MISFNKDYEPEKGQYFSTDKIKELMDAVLGTDPFYGGSYHDSLQPAFIAEIISFIMYQQNHKSLHLIVNKETDGYHLSVTIDKKEK